jgi:hypothetical protein
MQAILWHVHLTKANCDGVGGSSWFDPSGGMVMVLVGLVDSGNTTVGLRGLSGWRASLILLSGIHTRPTRVPVLLLLLFAGLSLVLVLVLAPAWGFWLAIRVETVGGALGTSGAASDRFYIPSEPLIRKYFVLIVTHTPLPCGCQDIMQ